MSNIFTNSDNNLSKIKQSQKTSTFKSGEININKSIGNLFSPLENFFNQNPDVISPDLKDINAEINKIQANALNIKSFLEGTQGQKINFIS